jgi:hypothetical protein
MELMSMKCNVGKSERLIRLAAGLALIGVSILWGGYWAILGAVIMMTALVGWCPISSLMGISTCKTDEEIPADTTAPHEDREIPDRKFK